MRAAFATLAPMKFFQILCFNFFAWYQNSIRTLLFARELPSTLVDFCLSMLQKLSSGEDGGFMMSFSPFMPRAAYNAEVFLATRDCSLISAVQPWMVKMNRILDGLHAPTRLQPQQRGFRVKLVGPGRCENNFLKVGGVSNLTTFFDGEQSHLYA